MFKRQHLWQIDWFLVAIVAGIVAIGAAFVWSASFRPGANGEGYYEGAASRQFIWIGAGVVLCAATALFIDYHKFLKFADLFYVLGVVVLLGMIAGLPVYRHRWFRLGSVMVQPSEFMKIAVILTLAKYVPSRNNLQRLRGWLAPTLLTLCPMVLVLQQPDLGAAFTLWPVLAAVLFAAGARRLHFALFGAGACLAVGLVVVTAVADLPGLHHLLQDYQKQRITSFFRQDRADARARLHELYQITQSKIAIGSGGLLGKGWGRGTQNRLNFLPHATRHTDFILAVIAEEAGFIGAVVVLLLFLVLFWGCLGLADRTADYQGKAIIVGLVALMATQVFINAGSAAGLLPTKGIALPFVSYGGSSMVVSFVGLGLVLNIGLHRRAHLAGGNRDELKPLRKVLK